MHYYQLHIGDYRKDTPHLSLIQHGAYLQLLNYLYTTEKPLPDNFEMLCRVCGAVNKAEQTAVREILEQFFDKSDHGFMQARAEREIGGYKGQQDHGRMMADARWGNKKANAGKHAANGAEGNAASNAVGHADGDAEAMLAGMQTMNHEPIKPPIVPQGDVKEADEALLIRAKALFCATIPRLPLRLDRSQLSAWKKNKGAVEQATEDEWQLLEEAYAQTEGDAARFRRKDLAQLLNNWCGEITRAADWKKKAGGPWRWQVQAASKEARAGQPAAEPAGWRAAVAEMFPDCDQDRMEWRI
jgi:uncharacterized protein YdaU (DUF1376 family)